jgi:lipopolysaccharide export LptBFGC system permease protein LptF
MKTVKRIVKPAVKAIAMGAALVFFFGNRVTGTAGTVLLCSIIVLFVFGILGSILEECWPDEEIQACPDAV